MSDEITPEAENVLDARLRLRHEHYVSELNETIDVDLSLAEILRKQDHAELLQGLTRRIDVETSLAETLAAHNVSNDVSSERVEHREDVGVAVSSLREFALSLFDIDPIDRIEFRTHTHLGEHSERLACGCVSTRRTAHNLIDAKVELVERTVSKMRARSFQLRAAGEVLTELRRLSTSARNGAFYDAVEKYRALTQQLASILDLDEQLVVAATEVRSLVNDLNLLEAAMNDFRGANLERVNFEDFRLSGIRFSESTRWPADMMSAIRENSLEVGEGVYEIRAVPE